MTQEQPWEKDFDYRFVGVKGVDGSIPWVMKNFIRNLIASERARAVEEERERIKEELLRLYGHDGGMALVEVFDNEGSVTQRPALKYMLELLTSHTKKE